MATGGANARPQARAEEQRKRPFVCKSRTETARNKHVLRHRRPAFRVAPETVGTEGYGLEEQLKKPHNNDNNASRVTYRRNGHIRSCLYVGNPRRKQQWPCKSVFGQKHQEGFNLGAWTKRQCMKPTDSRRV